MKIPNSTPIPINVKGYDTCYVEAEDTIGGFLLIAIPEHATKEISDICGTMVAGHFINQIDYEKANGKVSFIKAYFN